MSAKLLPLRKQTRLTRLRLSKPKAVRKQAFRSVFEESHSLSEGNRADLVSSASALLRIPGTPRDAFCFIWLIDAICFFACRLPASQMPSVSPFIACKAVIFNCKTCRSFRIVLSHPACRHRSGFFRCRHTAYRNARCLPFQPFITGKSAPEVKNAPASKMTQLTICAICTIIQ